MAADPATLVSLLPLLAASEKKQLLSEWSRAEKRYLPAKCVHEAFEETVKQHPEKFCVVSEGAQLTFLEVNQQANRLARLLRQLGIGPETSVGILLESSPEMVVAVLAILKAGGSYLPIDPALIVPEPASGQPAANVKEENVG
jgi:non-ribosomal peptide synthetase component F